MYCLSNICFLCLTDTDTVNFIVLQDAGNKIVQQVKLVLPEIVILEPQLLLPICSMCHQALDVFHDFKKICLENNSRYNDYITKLQGLNGNSKGKFGELEVRINEDTLTNLKEKSNIDSDSTEYEEEDNLVEDTTDMLDFTEKSEDKGQMYKQNLLKEIESNNVQECDKNSMCVDQIITDEIQSSDQESVSQNTFLADLNPKENIDELEGSTEQLIYQQVLKNETEPNNVQDCETNDLKLNLHTAKKYKCLVCNEIFGGKRQLNSHMIRHPRKLKHKCSLCNKILASKQSLRYHMAVHTGVKDYKCTLCDKSYSQRINLNYHMTTHTGEKDYKCSKCKKLFGCKGHLQRHMKLHSGAKEYECLLCFKIFVKKDILKRHMAKHTC